MDENEQTITTMLIRALFEANLGNDRMAASWCREVIKHVAATENEECQQQTWRRIETAPKDRPILALDAPDWIERSIEMPSHSTCPRVAYWSAKTGWCCWLNEVLLDPQWWCELPESPEVDDD